MNQQRINQDRNSLGIILQMVQNIEVPLTTLIEETYRINHLQRINSLQKDSKEILFSNTQEIKQLIDEVLAHIKSNQELALQPTIFKVFDSNERVRSMCGKGIDARRISKLDIAWLVDLEKEVYKNIDRQEIHLSDLAFSLAVSKRQLNRKVHSLLYLTPNKYIRILKLNKAKQLIDAFTCDRVSDISYAVGYSDTHYFSKLFQQQYGVTPKELLKENSW